MMNRLRCGIFQFALAFMALFLMLPVNQALSGEEELFTVVAPPDALLILDISGSMDWGPGGQNTPHWGKDESCTELSGTGSLPPLGGVYTVNCKRIEIAKRGIFALFDANGDKRVDAADEAALGIRFGFMRFTNTVTMPAALGTEIGTRYSKIYCGLDVFCFRNTNSGNNANSSHVSGLGGAGSTALNSALQQARTYLNNNKLKDDARECRKKYVILVSDGEDNLSNCGSENLTSARQTVLRAKELADAGYKVFVIGVGANMPARLQNILNWAAYHGGTENPLITTKEGNRHALDFTIIDHPHHICPSPPNTHDDLTSFNVPYPPGATVAQRQALLDPRAQHLRGYAFITGSGDELREAFLQIAGAIRQGSYSFTNPSVQTIRTNDENFLYMASFEPKDDSFWPGHLKQFEYNDDGTLKSSPRYNAGDVLNTQGTRTIKTVLGGAVVGSAMTDFTTSLGRNLFDVANDADRDAVVNHIRSSGAPQNWRLGDISRSGPVTIGTPNPYYRDHRDRNNAFAQFRDANVRKTTPTAITDKNRIVVVGTNAGQLHGFRTSDMNEAWSFIPPNLLPRLKILVPATRIADQSHQHFIDGPITVADVWLGIGDGTSKSAADWRTLLVFGLGRGGRTTLWSSSADCSGGTFGSTYTAATPGVPGSGTPYYCGYYALNVTSTTNPLYRWRLDPTDLQAPYMGEPWSGVRIGRVRTGTLGAETERWLGFMGGGFGSGATNAGKSFNIVNLETGKVDWNYTSSNNANMTSIPAPPAIVDTDGDGFIDRAYIGDIKGNMWRFAFCRAVDMAGAGGCNTRNGGLFAQNGAAAADTPIFTAPVVALDGYRTPWVFWGTGDKVSPTRTDSQDYFYGVPDRDTGTAVNVSSLPAIPEGPATSLDTSNGWRIVLGPREKVLSGSLVFEGVLYFATYTPPTDAEKLASPCGITGKGKLYAVHYLTGVGAFVDGSRSKDLGDGIPGDVQITFTRKGKRLIGNIVIGTSHNPDGDPNKDPLGMGFDANRMIYWKDRRVE